jgi:hypothetical protein
MGTDVAHRVKLAIDVVDADEITFQLRANAVAGTHFVRLGCFYEARDSRISLYLLNL